MFTASMSPWVWLKRMDTVLETPYSSIVTP
jgi:hypothetical protein